MDVSVHDERGGIVPIFFPTAFAVEEKLSSCRSVGTYLKQGANESASILDFSIAKRSPVGAVVSPAQKKLVFHNTLKKQEIKINPNYCGVVLQSADGQYPLRDPA